MQEHLGIRSWIRRLILAAGWGWVAVAVGTLLVFGGLRAADMMVPSGLADDFGIRYREHPLVALLHFAPGLLFIVLAPLQFVAGIRRARPDVHRWTGRILVPLAGLSGVYALVAAFWLPAYGGLPTVSATVVFGTYFLVALVAGVRAIRGRRVAVHRKWMIRLFALGLSVATIRAVIGLAQLATDLTFEEAFGMAFWVGPTLNAAIAELWIRWGPVPPGVPRRNRVRAS